MSGLHNAVIAYKNKAISEMLQDAELVHAIDDKVTSVDELIYRNIFPYFRVPTADTETLTYITVCVDLPEAYHPENFMRDIALKICVIVHQSEMETNYGATRLDYIAAKIDDIFSESLKYGYGKLRLLSSTESSLDQFHRYRELIFVSSEAQAGC